MSAGSVIRGNDITLEAWYRLDGSLVDPGTPRVTIRDPSNVAIVVNATPVRLSLGTYQYTFSVPLDAALGVWSGSWTGTIGAQGLGPITEDFTVLPVGYIVPVPSSSFTYNLATDVGKVRLLIDDRDMTAADVSLPLEQRSVIFTDEEIEYFLADKGSVMLAAGLALRTIANNHSLYVMRRQIGRTNVDYGTTKRDLLATADALDAADRITPADGVAERVWDDFTLRQLLTNTAIRV